VGQWKEGRDRFEEKRRLHLLAFPKDLIPKKNVMLSISEASCPQQ